MKSVTKSWRTTVGGILMAVGGPLSQTHEPSWLSPVGTALFSAGAALLGFSARDSMVTSKEAGAE